MPRASQEGRAIIFSGAIPDSVQRDVQSAVGRQQTLRRAGRVQVRSERGTETPAHFVSSSWCPPTCDLWVRRPALSPHANRCTLSQANRCTLSQASCPSCRMNRFTPNDSAAGPGRQGSSSLSGAKVQQDPLLMLLHCEALQPSVCLRAWVRMEDSSSFGSFGRLRSVLADCASKQQRRRLDATREREARSPK